MTEVCFLCNEYKKGSMAYYTLPSYGPVWACNSCTVERVGFKFINKPKEEKKKNG